MFKESIFVKIFYFMNFIFSSEYPPRLGGHRTGWLTVTNQAPVLLARAPGSSLLAAAPT